jgi:hypothetical protein
MWRIYDDGLDVLLEEGDKSSTNLRRQARHFESRDGTQRHRR